MTIAASTTHKKSSAVILLIATPLHDQNFFQMGEVGGWPNRYGLKNAVFAPLNHGNFAYRQSFGKNSANAGCNDRVTNFNILFTCRKFKRTEHLAFAFNDSSGA